MNASGIRTWRTELSLARGVSFQSGRTKVLRNTRISTKNTISNGTVCLIALRTSSVSLLRTQQTCTST